MNYNSRIAALQPILREMEELSEGESLSYTNTAVAVDTIRGWLYDHLGRTDQKGVFRITREASTILAITRKETFTSTTDLIGQLARFTAPVSKRKPAVMAVAQKPAKAKVPYTSGIAFADLHIYKAEDIAEFQKVVDESDLPKHEQVIAMEEWHRAHQAATQPQKHWSEMTKEEKGEAQPPEEAAASEGSGIEFYRQHADKTFAEFHPLVMASQESGELSELETSRAFDEHQRVHGMPSEGGDQK